MTDKYHSDTREKFETISYSPGIKDTGDLEPATKTIIRTSEATGTGNADYNAVLTMIVPSDSRLAINRIATRASVIIDSDDGTHDLRCRIYVDQQDNDHMLFDLTCSSTGDQLDTQDILAGTKETIFNLLREGNTHTVYFFFWSPGNHSPVISLCELWAGIGQGGSSYNMACLILDFTGIFSASWSAKKVGTGNVETRTGNAANVGNYIFTSTGASATGTVPCGILINPAVAVRSSTVATDLSYVDNIRFVLRSDN